MLCYRQDAAGSEQPEEQGIPIKAPDAPKAPDAAGSAPSALLGASAMLIVSILLKLTKHPYAPLRQPDGPSWKLSMGSKGGGLVMSLREYVRVSGGVQDRALRIRRPF